MIQLYLLAATGGAIGSLARFWLANAMLRLTGPGFPYGTVLINIIGSFAIGWLAQASFIGRVPAYEPVRVFTMVGLCGGFTTFSSFSLQTVELLRQGHLVAAGVNIVGSVLLCILASFAGLAVARL